MAREHRMIEPFEDDQVRDGVISYGLSSYGYDIRVADEFRIFTNVYTATVDPKNFDERSFVSWKGDTCIVPPNSFALARSVEYFRIPRSVVTLCVGKSTYARCFRGDTEVALVDGTAPSIEEMADRSIRGESFWGYSIGAFGRIIVTRLEAPRFVGRDSLLEVQLDNGQSVACTPDHEFLLRNGRLRAAEELRAGHSLMPLYRELFRGYEAVYQPLNGQLYPTHRLADEWNLRNRAYPDVPGTHRHHSDLDRRNNNPWNIERVEAGQHIRLHNSRSFGEEYASARSELRKSQVESWTDARAEFRKERTRNHRVEAVRRLPGDHDVYCLTVPEAGNFALAAGVFTLNCGIIVNVTPFEPEWEGHVTLEISNTTPLPAKIYAHEGIAQVLFFESDEPCERSYADRGGKYQAQRGVTLPRL